MINLRRSIFVTFLSTNIATVIQFAVTLILSRLLTPTEVGIFSITAVFINIIGVFRDFGVSSYLQQEKDLTPSKAQSAFGLLLTSSWILALATFLGRNIIADYYGEHGIAEVLKVLCISYAIVPFAAFFYAILGRKLEADKQALVNIFSAVAYAITCITLAYLGFSYMALAWANVANITTSIIIYLIIRPKEYICWPLFKEWSSPLKYGSGAIAGNLLNNINNSIPDLVLGKLSGAHDVGIFSRANGLVGIFQQIAGPTIWYNAIPFIASNHHSNAPMSPILSKATAYLTGVAWPAFIAVAVFSEEIIRVLYGEKWLEAAPIVSVVAIYSIIRFGYSLTQAALLAIGRPYLSVFSSGATIVAKLGIIFLFQANSLYSFAVAICIAEILTVYVSASLMSKYLSYSIMDSIKAHIPSIKVGIFCFLLTIIIKLLMPSYFPDQLKLVILFVIVLPGWVISIGIFKHPLCEEIPRLLSNIFPKAISAKMHKLFDINPDNS